MKGFRLHFFMASALLTMAASTVHGQLEPSCQEDSPERRGEIGCSLVENKPLPGGLKEPLFWHIDKFSSGDEARARISAASVAFKAHGSWWLMTIEPKVNDHHGGRHVTQMKLPALPPAKGYSMLVMSAYIPPGLTSRIHTHSGVEGFYVVGGQQCLETPTRVYKMSKGGSLVIPADVTMRLVATGTKPRRALAVIVYDSSQPPTTRLLWATARMCDFVRRCSARGAQPSGSDANACFPPISWRASDESPCATFQPRRRQTAGRLTL
jgi:quercetin dioxygenase-like cupin family protein